MLNKYYKVINIRIIVNNRYMLHIFIPDHHLHPELFYGQMTGKVEH